MDQLPLPLSELVHLYLYLSAPVYLIGLVLLYYVLKRWKVFSWPRLIGVSSIMILSLLLVTLGLGLFVSDYFLWNMWGPIHVGTFLALCLCAFLYWRPWKSIE